MDKLKQYAAICGSDNNPQETARILQEAKASLDAHTQSLGTIRPIQSAIEITEQWLLGGRCSSCRKKPYCNKLCSAYKRTREREIRQILRQQLTDEFGKTISNFAMDGRAQY